MKLRLLIFLIIAIIAGFYIQKYYSWSLERPLVLSTEILSGMDTSSPSIQKTDLIVVDTPQADAVITSPLEIRGMARGTWFFEATFPIVLVNWDGLIIAEGYATATEDWMTEDFVPFTADIEFETPTLYPQGALILQKSNPSDLPENDNALEIPINYWNE